MVHESKPGLDTGDVRRCGEVQDGGEQLLHGADSVLCDGEGSKVDFVLREPELSGIEHYAVGCAAVDIAERMPERAVDIFVPEEAVGDTFGLSRNLHVGVVESPCVSVAGGVKVLGCAEVSVSPPFGDERSYVTCTREELERMVTVPNVEDGFFRARRDDGTA